MKFKSFEQFVSEMDRSEEIEKDIKDTGTPVPMDIEDTEAEADEVQTNESEEGDAPEPGKMDGEEVKKLVSEMLESCYQDVVKEAMEWENDAHDDHTAESYMAENAALVAGLAGKALKECKEAYGMEAYEAALNTIKESFSNKIDSIKLQESGHDPEEGEEEPEAE